jgi:hypothetical protein
MEISVLAGKPAPAKNFQGPAHLQRILAEAQATVHAALAAPS